jgi:hypothetical protein
MNHRAIISLLFVLVAAPAAEPWQGEITATAAIEAPVSDDDSAELVAYAAELDQRMARLRGLIPTAPRAVQRIWREDLAAAQAERDRIGGRQELTTRFRIDGDRIRVEDAGGVLRIDRAAGTVQVGDPGEAVAASLRPLPPQGEPAGEVVTLPGAPGPGRRLSLRADGRTWQVDYVVGLPNPWALSLLDHVADDELAGVLATVPGLPWVATSTTDGVVRTITVTIRGLGR